MSCFSPRVLNLATATQVRETMIAVGVDPAGVARMVDKAQWLNILVEDVPCAAANILKQEMLAVGADAAVARGTVACSCRTTDLLLMASLKQFGRLIERLTAQPFGLGGLAAELQQLLELENNSPDCLCGRDCRLQLDRPRLMGVINVTPDSFYDGGRSFGVDTALRQAEQQVADGVDLLDIGGESTRPGAAAVSAEIELERVIPVVEVLRSNFSIPISVDTNKSSVAAAAVAAGANFINDISGLMFDERMADVAAASGAGVFVMHTRGRPEVMQQDTDYDDLMGEITAGLRLSLQRARAAGVAQNKLAVDPGIGFGKSVAGNLEILRQLSQLRCLACPILLGTSRKSFIGAVLGQPQAQQRLYGSLSTLTIGLVNGARLFRVHDVAPSRQSLDMAWAVCGDMMI